MTYARIYIPHNLTNKLFDIMILNYENKVSSNILVNAIFGLF